MNKLLWTLPVLLFLGTLPALCQTQGQGQNQGQNPGQGQGIEDERWIVEKDTRKIELPEANRNFEKITLEAPQLPPHALEYKPEDVNISVPKLTTKVGVAKLTSDKTIKKFYGNYVKAGIGNYATPYLEGFFNNKRSENYAYGLHLKHLTGLNGPVKYSPISQNMVDGYAKYMGKTYELTGKLSYDRNRNNFYGFNHEQPVNSDTLKHIFSTVHATAGLHGANDKSPIDYNLNFHYYNFWDNRKASESEFLATAAGGYKIDEEKSIMVSDVTLSLSSRKDSSKISRSFFQIKPAFIMDKGLYKVTGGFNVAYTNDTISQTKLHVYPRVNADLRLIEQTLTLFAGLDGEMQKNVLRTFTYRNPFLTSNVPLAHTNKALEIYGGGKGNIKGLNYKARISYASYKNLYFFNNSYTDSSKFTILYDKGNTTVLNVEGDFSYELTEKFRAGLNLNYFNYNTATLPYAFHRPNFVSTISGTYNLHDKIYFNTEIYYISGLRGRNFISREHGLPPQVIDYRLKNIADVNLKVDYKFSNVVSAFLEVNNLLSRKYQRYLYYPVKGINIIAGVSCSF